MGNSSDRFDELKKFEKFADIKVEKKDNEALFSEKEGASSFPMPKAENAVEAAVDRPLKVRTKNKSRKKRTAADMIRLVLIFVFATVFAVSAVMLASEMIQGKMAEDFYNDMSEDFFSGSDRTDYLPRLLKNNQNGITYMHGIPRVEEDPIINDYEIISTTNPFFEKFREKLLSYKAQNDDIYGWIQVDGTDISYPIVKGDNNSYYINHNASKEQNLNGAIFADYRLDDSYLKNQNMVLYGHNSLYRKQMFHQLIKFKDEDFFRENRYVTIYTFDGILKYEIFAFYDTQSTSNYTRFSFPDDESFVNWCEEMSSKSWYDHDIGGFTPSTRIITLSTCTNIYYTERYSLQAKLISIEK